MFAADRVASLSGDPGALERLHRAALQAGETEAFADAIGTCAERDPADPLLAAWCYRLGLRSPDADAGAPAEPAPPVRRWGSAVLISVVLGLLFALLAGGGPPVPAPGAARPAFWIGWAPLTALGILLYLAAHQRRGRTGFAWAAAALVLLAAATAVLAGHRSDDVAVSIALHLPFCAWAVLGLALCIAHPDPARHGYAFLVKSAETLLSAGVHLAAAGLFLLLTVGIFAAIGIEIPDAVLRFVAPFIIGMVPVLALASVYDVSLPPAAQDWNSGLTRLLRLLTRLLLPLAIAVLLVYVFWFIPAYFQRGFEQRELLAVYNVTIFAILVLLTLAMSGPGADGRLQQQALLRRGLLLLGALALLLNLYALSAIVVRIIDGGWTPNRVAVLGWNVTTLAMMLMVAVQLRRQRAQPWQPQFRAWTARAVLLAAAWSLCLLLLLPLVFDSP